ncbi:hypothetical protein BE21_03660 [Sorangium cellulosum]|uniref:PEGA domain-containing protein n=1 Tax=Sorangium cellulosum TaxID=56 RepID=A0A150TLI1_SORCE|nr:hypothetical protein BE21_03660 [Sorangium cellulosum]
MRFVALSWLGCLALGATAGFASSASAEEDIYSMPERSEGSAVSGNVRRGRRARDAGRWVEARAAYAAAFEATDPASSTERERAEIAGELGLCELALKQYRDAAEHLARSLEQRDALPLQLQLRFEAGQRKAAPHVGTLYLSVDPPDAEVLVDGKPVSAPARTYRLFLEPGQHMVRARLAGHEEAFASFDAQAGKPTTISLQVPRAVTQAAVPAKSAATVTWEPNRSARGAQASSVASSPTASKLRIAGAVLAGATMAAGGGFLTWSAYTEDELHDRATALRNADREADRCSRPNAPRACSELRDLQEQRDLLEQVGWVSLATGGAVGALTLVSLFVDRTSSPDDGVRVVPTASGQHAGLIMVGAW